MKKDFEVVLVFLPWQAQKIVHIGEYPYSIASDMARATAKAEKASHYLIRADWQTNHSISRPPSYDSWKRYYKNNTK